MSLNVRIVTPQKVVWDEAVEMLSLPTTTGEIGILKDHAPLATALDIGVMWLRMSKVGWTSIFLLEGFAEVRQNKVTVVSNESEEGSSIDMKIAMEEFEKASLKVKMFDKEAETSKEKIDTILEFRRAKARYEAVVSGAPKSVKFS
jgi:F-type H+-transporting ATPase subunit epsilon